MSEGILHIFKTSTLAFKKQEIRTKPVFPSNCHSDSEIFPSISQPVLFPELNVCTCHCTTEYQTAGRLMNQKIFGKKQLVA
jgi:hypothetical protein